MRPASLSTRGPSTPNRNHGSRTFCLRPPLGLEFVARQRALGDSDHGHSQGPCGFELRLQCAYKLIGIAALRARLDTNSEFSKGFGFIDRYNILGDLWHATNDLFHRGGIN